MVKLPQADHHDGKYKDSLFIRLPPGSIGDLPTATSFTSSLSTSSQEQEHQDGGDGGDQDGGDIYRKSHRAR